MSRLEQLFSIRGRTALVTGGTVGIGEMIARAYVEAGAEVFIASRKEAQCEAVASELSKLGTCTALPADLSTEEGCRDLATRVSALAPKLDILVNNAGATWGAPIEEFPAKGWDRALDLNLKAPFYMVQSLLPSLSAAGTKEAPARVINIGSNDGVVVPVTETYSYAASKAGLHHLTRVLARQLAARHITVNAIVPGPFPSRMMAQMLETRGDEIAAMSPLGRVGTPDDMAAAAIYLASPGGSWTTGTLLSVDGGINGALAPSAIE